MKAQMLGALLLLGAAISPAVAADGPIVGEGDESLQVVVGPSGTSLEALAVPEVRCVGGADQSVCKQITRVLRRDMTLSFLFEILPPRSYLADPASETLDAPRFQDWNAIGANFLIKGEISGTGPYTARFRFFNATQGVNVPVTPQTFDGVSRGGLRTAAHRFCNAVIKARTGVAGVFGTKIAYSKKIGRGKRAVGTVAMDGYNAELTISNGSINMLPTWGFGGLLYTSFKDGQPRLYFGKRKLSSDRGQYRKVAVSPTNSTMVASISYGGQSDLFLVGRDGAVIRNLTNSKADEVSPTFSPDGSQIAYVSSAAGSPQIYVMSVGGGEGRRLTHVGGYNYAPDWGPNGLIVFASINKGKSDIFTVDQSGAVTRLTQNQGTNKDPSWSKDGRYVAFVSRRAAGSGLWLMSADGRYQAMISKGGGYGNTAWQR